VIHRHNTLYFAQPVRGRKPVYRQIGAFSSAPATADGIVLNHTPQDAHGAEIVMDTLKVANSSAISFGAIARALPGLVVQKN
jgi:hypothetical protein